MKNLIFVLLFSFAFANSIQELESKCENGESPVPCDIVGVAYYSGYGADLDYVKALYFFKKACSGGLYSSCSVAGVIYELGLGVKNDKKEAMKFYEISCKGKFGGGCQNLADVYSDEKDEVKAMEYYKKGCEFGAWISCETLAKHYEEIDKKKSLEYYKSACEFGKDEMAGQVLPIGIMRVKLACDKADEL